MEASVSVSAANEETQMDFEQNTVSEGNMTQPKDDDAKMAKEAYLEPKKLTEAELEAKKIAFADR